MLYSSILNGCRYKMQTGLREFIAYLELDASDILMTYLETIRRTHNLSATFFFIFIFFFTIPLWSSPCKFDRGTQGNS